jgi:hypothetical protein
VERNREPMNKNRIEGGADQGERAINRKALVVKDQALSHGTSFRRRSGVARWRIAFLPNGMDAPPVTALRSTARRCPGSSSSAFLYSTMPLRIRRYRAALVCLHP